MKTTTLAIIVVLTAMILVTAGAFNSPALAAKGSDTGSKGSDTGSKGSDTGSKGSDTGSKGGSSSPSDTSSSGTSSTGGGTSSTGGGTSGSVGKQLKSLISCLTSTSKLTGTIPTSAQYKTCEAQSNFGTLGGSAIGGSAIGGAKTSSSGKAASGGGLVPLTSGLAGPSFLGTTGKAPKTSGP